MVLTAYAKVNLHLAVTGRLENGYHTLVSVFRICRDYSDTIEFSFWEAAENSFDVTGLEQYCEKGRDTVSRALEFFSSYTGLRLKAEARIKKGIPVQSGMGGGSSDAAEILKALNAHFNVKVDAAYLSRVALGVGCDVPFFLTGFQTALVQGIGEKVKELPFINRKVTVVLGQKPSSTASAFSLLDSKNIVSDSADADFIEKAYLENRWEVFYNDFDRVIEKPEGAVSLTGSGTAGIRY